LSNLITPNLMVLGSGISPEGIPTAVTLSRADTAAEYYEAFPQQIGRIVCCGAYSLSMDEPPANGATEGQSAADRLVRRGVPAAIVEVEKQSTCTFTNYIEVVQGEYFAGTAIDPDHPLGVVTGWAHGLRARRIGMQALGVPRRAVQIVRSPGENAPQSLAFELGGAVLTRAVLLDAAPGNIEHTRRAQKRFEGLAGELRRVR
jgi:hypothetical protein